MSDYNKILSYLQSGHTITFNEAQELFGTNSLRERIKDLRKLGYNITGEDVKNPNTGRYHRVYKLEVPAPYIQPVVYTENAQKQLQFI
jgi:hypothetical protein